MTFTDRLIFAMKKRGIEKQSILAYKTKIDKSYISKYISGKCKPTDERLEALAKALNVSPLWLKGYDIEDETPNFAGVEKVPVLGYVAAGIPIEAIQDILDYEEISPDMLEDGSEYFALKLKGDSMSPRMNNGDVVIVRKQPDVDSGQIAVVAVDGNEATCKKVMKQEGGILLVPLNSAYAPMFYSTKEIEDIPITILGRVVELRAKF